MAIAISRARDHGWYCFFLKEFLLSIWVRVLGHFFGLGVAAEEGQALGFGELEAARGGGVFQRAVAAEDDAPVVGLVVGAHHVVGQLLQRPQRRPLVAQFQRRFQLVRLQQQQQQHQQQHAVGQFLQSFRSENLNKNIHKIHFFLPWITLEKNDIEKLEHQINCQGLTEKMIAKIHQLSFFCLLLAVKKDLN